MNTIPVYPCVPIWSYPSMKISMAKRLASYLPDHRVYVEPFASNVAVLLSKAPSEVEVVNSLDEEVAEALSLIKGLAGEQLDQLAQFNWKGDPSTYWNLLKRMPKDDIPRLYRFLYLSRFGDRRHLATGIKRGSVGVDSNIVGRLEKAVPRFQNLQIASKDYEAVVQEYDGPDTVFFVDVSNVELDEKQLAGTLNNIEGKYLLKRDDEITANYELEEIAQVGEVRKARIITFNDVEESRDRECPAIFTKSIPILKDTSPDDERYVLGVVLKPETVDAQNEIYSKDEVRRVAHLFLEEFGGLGLQHRFQINKQVRILESYVSPLDGDVAGHSIPEGTWMMAVRVLDNGLWKQIQGGELTGFSVGGSAVRVPETTDSGESINRLHDMVVREISLVDRAANQTRFLIAKRREEVKEGQKENVKMEKNESGEVESQDVNQEIPEGEPSVEGHTEQVEPTAPEMNEQSAEQFHATIDAINEMTQSITQMLSSQGESEEKAESTENPEQDSEEQKPEIKAEALVEVQAQITEMLSTLKEALSPFTAIVEAYGKETTKSEEAPTEKEQKSSADNQLEKKIDKLAQITGSIAKMMENQQKRLSHVEKSFGLPSSLPVGEATSKPNKGYVSWPMDLNSPVDKESTNKDVSFHDVK